MDKLRATGSDLIRQAELLNSVVFMDRSLLSGLLQSGILVVLKKLLIHSLRPSTGASASEGSEWEKEAVVLAVLDVLKALPVMKSDLRASEGLNKVLLGMIRDQSFAMDIRRGANQIIQFWVDSGVFFSQSRVAR